MGIISLAVGGIWFFATTTYLVPLFRGSEEGYRMVSRYAYLGNDLGTIFRTIFFDPVYVLQNLLIPEKIGAWLFFLVPLAFLPLLSGWGLLLFLVPILLNSLAGYRVQYLFYEHYSLPVYAFSYIAAVLGARRLTERLRQSRLIWPSFHLKRVCSGLAALLVTAGIISSYFFSPVLGQGLDIDYYRTGEHEALGRSLLSTIPPQASVRAQTAYVPHLSQRPEVYMFPRGPETEIVFLDTKSFRYPLLEYYESEVKKLVSGGNYGVTNYQDGYILLKKGCPTPLNQVVLANLQRKYEAEELVHTGQVVADDAADGDGAVRVVPGKDSRRVVVYGPSQVFEKGKYTASFRIRAGQVSKGDLPAATIDAYQTKRQVTLAKREILASELSDSYRLLSIEFDNPDENEPLEFRVHLLGEVELLVDSVKIVPIKQPVLSNGEESLIRDFYQNRVESCNVVFIKEYNIIAPGDFDRPAYIIFKFELPPDSNRAKATVPVHVAYQGNYVKISTSSDGKNFSPYEEEVVQGTAPISRNEVFVLDKYSSNIWVKFEMLVSRATSVTSFDARIDSIYVRPED